ncbi:hypothetical protein RHECNPAF_122100157 [Rhizobium etli CNPAF512]|nr:hypothetical protein RHECNPAF_122100157 [Rhizobium etli CNPAF512]
MLQHPNFFITLSESPGGVSATPGSSLAERPSQSVRADGTLGLPTPSPFQASNSKKLPSSFRANFANFANFMFCWTVSSAARGRQREVVGEARPGSVPPSS